MRYSEENKVDGIVLVPDGSQEYLNPRQEVTYREHRRELTPSVVMVVTVARDLRTLLCKRPRVVFERSLASA